MNLRQKLSLLILLLINFLFAYKYLSEIIHFTFVAALFYIAATYLLFYYGRKYNLGVFKKPAFFLLTVAGYVSFHIILFQFIKQEDLNVDRWSVIQEFWGKAIQGQYPYSARSHMGNFPGPMPVYFIISFPFYLIHETGFLSITGFLILTAVIYKYFNIEGSSVLLVMLVISTAVFWEIVTRSTILVNAMLFLMYQLRMVKSDLKTKKKFWISAIAAGLILSTRSVFSLILISHAVFMLKNKPETPKQIFYWGAAVIFVFSLTIIPFLLIWPNDFFRMNPFIIQSDFLLPFYYVPIFFMIASLAGFFTRSAVSLTFHSGLVLFAVFCFYFAHYLINYGFTESFFQSRVDLSYSIFSFPFFLVSLLNSGR